jgi:beta-xylosidase
MNKILLVLVFALTAALAPARTWTADNGNGTFTNPLFYDEFSDPDLIRVGDDYYLTGTTMHAMPGLPVLHSKDLVNWELLGYACGELNFGPEYRLENGQSIYGQGIWAPSFRFYNGKFYIFSNVNHRRTQLFTATNPAGPWTHQEMKKSLHDLSVLFDDDGKVYVIWGYQEIHLAQLTADLTDTVSGTERIITPKNAGLGEGSHFYKINGKYYITSACWDGRMRMACARADRPEGPYEVNRVISTDESFGLAEGNRLGGTKDSPFNVIPGNTADAGRVSLHQGGLVRTSSGEWWGFSMMDYNSVGRLTSLSPVTWTNGWPYFGLPGNLTRTPRTWVKPATGQAAPPSAPYQRDDEFAGPQLANVWQWNHVPDRAKWSLAERPGFLRLHSLPAPDLWNARNTLTQRAIGPESTPTAELDADGLRPGDVAGLALLNYPYAWIGVSCGTNGFELVQFDQRTGKTAHAPFAGGRVWLRAQADFLTEQADFSYSTDGKIFQTLGDKFVMVFQLHTFQGIRYALFNFNTAGVPGGAADFDRFTVDEPHPRGLMRPIPFGKTIALASCADGSAVAVRGETQFRVVDRGLGRVALQSGRGFVSVTAGADGKSSVGLKPGEPADAETFQWTESVYGDLLLLSLATQRHLCLEPGSGTVTADAPGARPDRRNGVSFTWREVGTALPSAANPFGQALIPDLVADPSIVDLDGTFYCYATTDGAGAGLATSGTPVVWKSRDFLNWSFCGSSFSTNFNAKYWAPSSLIRRDGRCYSYPTLDGKITAVVADSPEGPFRTVDGKDINPQSGWQPFPLVQKSSIDAEVFVDDDGQAYMVWSRRRMVKLKADLVTPDGPEIAIPTKRPGYSEGPFLFKRNGIYYYLYTLGGNEGYQYAYMMSRTSPLGPWEAPTHDIIATTDHSEQVFGPGHGCFFHPHGSGQWYFVYLEYGRGGTTRQIYADELNFNADGTLQPVKLTKQGVGALRPPADSSPNLALGQTATASSTQPDFKVMPRADKTLDRTETYAPANAIDGSNGSRWLAAADDSTAWWQLDLGAPREIRRTEAYFVKPTAGHAYRLESSLDGKNWLPYGGHENVMLQSPHTDTKAALVRYLRLTILKGTPGLWEFRVY